GRAGKRHAQGDDAKDGSLEGRSHGKGHGLSPGYPIGGMYSTRPHMEHLRATSYSNRIAPSLIRRRCNLPSRKLTTKSDFPSRARMARVQPLSPRRLRSTSLPAASRTTRLWPVTITRPPSGRKPKPKVR